MEIQEEQHLFNVILKEVSNVNINQQLVLKLRRFHSKQLEVNLISIFMIQLVKKNLVELEIVIISTLMHVSYSLMLHLVKHIMMYNNGGKMLAELLKIVYLF